MCNKWFILIFMLAPFIAHADDPKTAEETPASPSSYEMLRFNENYSYLANPALRTDWLDPLKYIPLRTNNPAWYLTIGGELRERFEGAENPNFGLQGNHDDYWLQRITLLGDLHLGDRVRFFVEGISGLMEGESQPAPPPQKDPYDLQFAFVDVVPYLTDSESLALRAGRFGLSLGSGRLVATRAAPNIPFKFDGFELLYTHPLWEATGFLTRPVLEDPYHLSSDDSSTIFWGLYLTHWFDTAHQLGLDLYYLGLDSGNGSYESGTGREDRHSFGTRVFGGGNELDWNAESVVQTGTFGKESILAWTASLDTGYTLNAQWQPRFGLKADIASGNNGNGHQGTFDALYFKSGYFNDASLLRPQNIIDIHPNITLNPSRSVSVDGGVDVFWRYSKSDAIYSPAGFIQIPASSAGSSYIGTALDLNFQWQIQKHLTFAASYVYLFTGDYVHTSGCGDVNYVSTTLSFLF
jgi:Alginate export